MLLRGTLDSRLSPPHWLQSAVLCLTLYCWTLPPLSPTPNPSTDISSTKANLWSSKALGSQNNKDERHILLDQGQERSVKGIQDPLGEVTSLGSLDQTQGGYSCVVPGDAPLPPTVDCGLDGPCTKHLACIHLGLCKGLDPSTHTVRAAVCWPL